MEGIEKYLVLYPDGSMRWIQTEHENIGRWFREVIGCSLLEHVALPCGFGCIVDESGKTKDLPQLVNVFASVFYPGFFYGDPLVGPVIFVRTGYVDGEPDWLPLRDSDLRLIEQTIRRKIPD